MTPTVIDGLLALGAALGPLTVRLAHPHKPTIRWAALGEAALGMFSTVIVWNVMLAFGLATPDLVRAATATWIMTLAVGASFGGVCTVLVQLLVVRFKERAARLIKRWLPAEDDTPVPTRRWADDPKKLRRRWDDYMP